MACEQLVAVAVITPRLTTVNAVDVYVDAETILGLEACVSETA